MRTSLTVSLVTGPVFVLRAGWGRDVSSHVGGASMGRAVSTIVRRVLSNVISSIMPTIPTVNLDGAITSQSDITQYPHHSVRTEPHVSQPLASVTVGQAGEASTVTPLVQQGPGAKTVPGTVAVIIMECVTMVSTIYQHIALPIIKESSSLLQ